MKAEGTIFQNLLNGQIQYRVPLFQRTYSWNEDQWEKLWDDILEIYMLDKPRNHFIGAVVTLPRWRRNNASAEVNDGCSPCQIPGTGG